MKKEKANTSASFNPWPYSIIGFFVLVVIAVVVWVVFCIGHSTDLVSADYYEQEVEYQDQIDRLKRTESLGAKASISYEAGADAIRIRLPLAHAASNSDGMIHLYRPSEAGLDQKLPLVVGESGEQLIGTATLRPGLWRVRVSWINEGQEYFMNEELTLGSPAL